MNRLGIDVETRDKMGLIRRLTRLKSVECVADGGEYWMDTTYSQVLVTTTMTESELDDWLYKFSHVAYVGTYVLTDQYLDFKSR